VEKAELVQKCLCIGGATCALWLGTAKVCADPPLPRAMRLEYTRERGAERCPDEQAFRDVVEARLTYAPFSPEAVARLVVTLKRKGWQVQGRMELRDSDDALLWERDMGPFASCQDLVLGLGFSAAVKLGVSSTPPPAPAPEPPAPAPPPPPTPVPPPVIVKLPPPVKRPPPVEPKNSFKKSGGLGVAFGAGVAPTSPTFGLTVNGGLRWPSWSLALEARSYPWVEGKADEGTHYVSTYRITGALVACGHWRMGFGCGLVELGVQHVEKSVPNSFPRTMFYAGGGFRLGLEIPLVPDRLAVRITADVIPTLYRVTYRSNGSAEWVTPPVSGALGVAGFMTF
jgi:hypothetical protein